ncbi:hypothetical protein BK652_09970 [Pseudomonas brassicacearum]|uniref:Uncharacterized protein n=1 Tax=Pseudomonas brassicacearum TaxID=930166 RepID=A0A423GDG7_9PSED|nr:hypothetical protein [Pseudomonas brassicacearum]ROM84896.1 hypothetical protein BK652_09970 [Pseudomonas brassicacearum]
MHNLDLLPQLLTKIAENQLALEAAIMELSNWAAVNGSAVVDQNVRGALATLERNDEFVKTALAVINTPE